MTPPIPRCARCVFSAGDPDSRLRTCRADAPSIGACITFATWPHVDPGEVCGRFVDRQTGATFLELAAAIFAWPQTPTATNKETTT